MHWPLHEKRMSCVFLPGSRKLNRLKIARMANTTGRRVKIRAHGMKAADLVTAWPMVILRWPAGVVAANIGTRK